MRRLIPLSALLAVAIVLLVVSETWLQSVADPTTTGAVAAPRLEPAPGVYPRGAAVTLRPSETTRRINFTTDGTLPTSMVGAPYERSIRFAAEVPGVRVVRAVEYAGSTTGPVTSASYVVGLEPDLPIVSLIAEPADLWGEEAGLFTNPSWRGAAWERPAHVTFFLDGDVVASPVGLRIDGREPLSAPKQTLRLYFRSEYEETRLVAPLFQDHPTQAPVNQSFKRLLLQAGDHGAVWSLLRDQVVAQVLRDLGVPATEGRFVRLFVNGSSWGIYRLTERVTRFLLDDEYGIAEADVLQEGDAREGSDADWDALIDWAEASDLADPDHYATLAAQMDMANLIDIAVFWHALELPAEALIAVQPLGGRWFWFFEGGSDPEVASRHASDFAALHRALMANMDYRERFTMRLADLINTALSPAALDAQLSSFASDLSAAFEEERGRWTGVPTWSDELTALHSYTERRLAEVARQAGIASPVTLAPWSEGDGRVYINGLRVRGGNEGWRGLYPAGAEVELIAVPAPGTRVAGWEQDGASFGAATRITVTAGHAMTLTASFVPDVGHVTGPRPDDVIINEVWINDDGTRHATLGYLPLEGDWIELLVTAAGGVDMRGWRLTDNDTKTATTEGSITFPDDDVWASVPCGTVILVIATETPLNSYTFAVDDLDPRDGVMRLYVGNGHLDVTTDPGFGLGTGNDNIALLAPGASPAFEDDIGIDFVAEGRRVTPASFGILVDGVTFDEPFTRLGADDGALFAGLRSNDDLADWLVDPPACSSGDEVCYGYATLVTPGALNPAQRGYRMGCFLRRLGLGR